MTPEVFEATLLRPEGIGTWTYLNVPFNAQEKYGSKGQIKVQGSINGVPYRSTLLPHGNGKHYLVISKQLRDKIGASQDDIVRVVMQLDTQPRSVEIPSDLKTALRTHRGATAIFQHLPPSHQKEYIAYIVEAKRDATRRRRIEQSMEMLLTGARPKQRRSP